MVMMGGQIAQFGTTSELMPLITRRVAALPDEAHRVPLQTGQAPPGVSNG